MAHDRRVSHVLAHLLHIDTGELGELIDARTRQRAGGADEGDMEALIDLGTLIECGQGGA